MDITHDYSKSNPAKRYATAAILLGGSAVLAGGLLAGSYPKNYGLPFTHNGQRYYVPGDSRRVIYPSREACLRDVPPALQAECEPYSNYHGGSSGSWYGPLYSPGNTGSYRPTGQYPSEPASSSNFGKKLPTASNSTGFGANGKAFSGSKGG